MSKIFIIFTEFFSNYGFKFVNRKSIFYLFSSTTNIWLQLYVTIGVNIKFNVFPYGVEFSHQPAFIWSISIDTNIFINSISIKIDKQLHIIVDISLIYRKNCVLSVLCFHFIDCCKTL